jgi:hypothetical protein
MTEGRARPALVALVLGTIAVVVLQPGRVAASEGGGGGSFEAPEPPPLPAAAPAPATPPRPATTPPSDVAALIIDDRSRDRRAYGGAAIYWLGMMFLDVARDNEPLPPFPGQREDEARSARAVEERRLQAADEARFSRDAPPESILDQIEEGPPLLTGGMTTVWHVPAGAPPAPAPAPAAGADRAGEAARAALRTDRPAAPAPAPGLPNVAPPTGGAR